MALERSRQRFADYRRAFTAGRSGQQPSPGTRSSENRPHLRPLGRLLAEFWRLIAGHRGAIAVSLGTATVGTLLALLPPIVTKLTIDNVLADHPLERPWTLIFPASLDRWQLLWWLAGAVVVVSLLQTGIGLLSRWFVTRTLTRLQIATRRRAFEHAVRLPLHRVYQIRSGGVASILREDANSAGDLVYSMIYTPWKAVVQLGGSLVILAWVDWRLLAGAVLLLPVKFFTHRTWIGRIRPLYRDIRGQRQEIDSSATETFAGMRVVRGFGRQRSEASRFAHSNHYMARQQIYAWWWSRCVEVLWEILIPLALAALLLYGGSRVLNGKLTLGELWMFVIYLIMLLSPLAVLAASATAFQSSLAGLDRVLDLLAEPREMTDYVGETMVRKDQVRGRVVLRNVSFRYPGSSERVLSDINLDVHAGQSVALVGRSGAGKTTLCNLVARFYDPTTGTVELDGIDLRQTNVESYRRLLGIVEQDVFLFDGSVADNIGYALRGATPQQIERAARSANAHEFIVALDDGYQTVIGERGVRLSGGQRQRIAIARALLADPRILILDEATSNLDSHSEQLIQDSLLELMRGRTSFIIAHRLSTIAHVDRILVLDDGKIVESGTPAELLARDGPYRQMVELQTVTQAPLIPADS